MAATGHKSSFVCPRKTSVPLPSWSVFENFSRIRMRVGASRLSTAKSLKLRWRVASYSACPGTVILPALKNPKKHIVQAAQSIIVSGSLFFLDHSALTLRRIDGVIGSLVLVAKLNAWTFLMPLLTTLSLGMGGGSGPSSLIWKKRIADKYVFIV